MQTTTPAQQIMAERKAQGWPVEAIDQAAVDTFVADAAANATPEQISQVIERIEKMLRRGEKMGRQTFSTMAATADALRSL